MGGTLVLSIAEKLYPEWGRILGEVGFLDACEW